MHSKSHHQSSMNNVGVDSTLIDRERRQLEKIKFRQVLRRYRQSCNLIGERNKANG